MGVRTEPGLVSLVSNTSWTRTAYCATPAFARYAVEEAERAGLVATGFFGSEKQVTLRGPDLIARAADATGSSSFELSNTIMEPLTGRKSEFHLYPLSIAELLTQETPLEAARLLERRLRYGMYPGVVVADDPDETVLEKAFIIFHLPPFSRNLRKELAKLRKVYFYDLGVRNALINNFNPTDLRNDGGALWENFFISERIKFNRNRRRHVNAYFWRTYDRAGLDYLEEEGGRLVGFECKWTAMRSQRPSRGWRPPAAFAAAYAESETHLVNPGNYRDFLTP
jgi:hypothetical protein